MKAAETKTASATLQKKSGPFFQKENNQPFFGNTDIPFFTHSPVQAKLNIGQPNDKYEQEADTMADQVVQRLATPEVQTKKETAIQAKPLATQITPFIQTKCATYEQEDKIQKKEEEDLVQESPLELRRKPIFEGNTEPPPDDEKNVQRKCAACEQEEDQKIQAKADNPGVSTASPSIETALSNSKGSGNPLPATTRNEMESSFGVDFSNVKIHNDSSAVQMSKDLNAQAFTHGSDVYFNAGKYDTGSTEGKRLLGHELTHVVQQKRLGEKRLNRKADTTRDVGEVENSVWDNLGNAYGSVSETISSGFGSIGEGALSIGHQVAQGVSSAWHGTQSVISSTITGVRQAGTAISEVFSETWNSIEIGARQIISNTIDFVTSALNGMEGYVQNLVHTVIDFIQSFITNVTTYISETIDSILSNVVSLAKNICNSICDGLLPLLSVAGVFYRGTTSAYNQARSLISSGYTTVSNWFASGANYATNLYNNVVNRASSVANTVWNWISSHVPYANEVITSASHLTGRLNGWISRQISGQINAITNVFRSVSQSVTNGVSEGFNSITTRLSGFFVSRFPNLFDKINRVRRLISDLMRVDWAAPFDTQGMQGDWKRLFFVWFCEQSPSDIGEWTTEGMTPTVTIVPGSGYTVDLQNRPHHQHARLNFIQAHPDLSTLSVGEEFDDPFGFSGEGTATGGYNIVEWFLGSYNTKMTVLAVDEDAQTVTINVEVTNRSHWESATRVPAVGQNAGLPRALIPDMVREDCGPGGDFMQRFIWNEALNYSSDNLQQVTTTQPAAPIEDIAAQHMLYEFAAHRIAYLSGHGSLTLHDKNTLREAGYGTSEREVFWLRGTLGFQVVYIKSTNTTQNDIIAIRGTDPGVTTNDLMTVYSDLDVRAVGMHQYLANRHRIASMMEYTRGRVDVTGHSLGGAMAQHVGADPDFIGRVANVITFQSPGINMEEVNSFNALPPSMRPNVIHHIVTGDVVDRGGDANLPGTVYEHNLGNETNMIQLIEDIKAFASRIGQHLNQLTDISDTSAASIQFEQVREEVRAFMAYLADTASVIGEAHGTFAFSASNYDQIRTEHHVGTYGAAIGRASTVTTHQTYPHTAERNVSERVRRNVGPMLSNLFRTYFLVAHQYESLSTAVRGVSNYIRTTWEDIRDQFT